MKRYFPYSLASRGIVLSNTYDDNFSRTERGATMVEYSLMGALIAVVVVASVTLAGKRSKDTYCKVVLASSPKWVAPVGGGEGEPPDVDECGRLWGIYAP
ncbi:MAG: hypothetical protein U0136_00635 [Bdellovibrionota bacterium]